MKSCFMFTARAKKGPTGTFFLHIFNSFFSLLFFPVHSSSWKIKLGKKKKSRPTDWLAVFLPTRPTGNDNLPKVGLI